MLNAPVDPSPSPGGSAPVGPGGRAPQEPAASVDNVGALVAARDRAGMTSADIVSLLKMAPRQVDALERGDWAALPGLAFVRGALRSYGRAVGVTVDPLLASLDSGAKASELRPSTSLQEPLPSKSMLGFGSGGSGNKTTWLFLAAILLIALAFFFGRDTDFSRMPSLLQSAPKSGGTPPAGGTSGQSGTTVESIPVLPQGPGAPAVPGSSDRSAPGQAPAAPGGNGAPGSSLAPGSSPAPGPSTSADGMATAQVLPVASSASAAGSASPLGSAGTATLVSPGPPPDPSAGAASAAAPGASATPSGPLLRLSFEREAWVEIRQADGKVLLYGQQKAGSDAQVPFAGAVSLTIGNSDHVRLERDGKPVDLKAISRQGVARLKLNP